MFQVAIFSLTIIGLYFLYRYISKNNYNINGLELTVYELSFVLLFIIGNYYVKFNGIQKELGYILLMFLDLYYLLKTLKTQKYTSVWIILIYILLFFVNAIAVNRIPTVGMGELGLAVFYIVFTFGTIAYILLMNFISFIIRHVRKKKIYIVEDVNSKPLYKSIFNILILIITISVSFLYIPLDKYIYNKINVSYKDEVSKYLKNKYTNLDFEIYDKNVETAMCINRKCHISNPTYYIETDLLNEGFYVDIYLNVDEQKITDNFIESYYYEITNGDSNKYFSDLLGKKFKDNGFNVDVNISVDFDSDKTSDVNTILKEEELLQLVEIDDLKIIINDNFNTNKDFENYATELYKFYESYIGKYNQRNTLEYEFAYPDLNSNIIFKNGGSVDKLYNKITVYYNSLKR